MGCGSRSGAVYLWGNPCVDQALEEIIIILGGVGLLMDMIRGKKK